MANEASARTGGLKRGSWITTGSWTGNTFASAGSRVDVRFSSAGSVSAALRIARVFEIRRVPLGRVSPRIGLHPLVLGDDPSHLGTRERHNSQTRHSQLIAILPCPILFAFFLAKWAGASDPQSHSRGAPIAIPDRVTPSNPANILYIAV